MWAEAARGSSASIHKRLDACRSEIKEDRSGASRAWAFDLPSRDGGGAPKAYVAASAPVFAALYEGLPPASRNAYEVIDAALPCWVYFDLEFVRSATLNLAVDGERLSTLVVDTAVAILEEALSEAEQAVELHGADAALARRAVAEGRLEVEVVALDSHRVDKWSRHAILRPHLLLPSGARVPLLLASQEQAGRVAKAVIARLGQQLDVDKRGGGGVACFVDKSVYSCNRAFRLVGSSKLGSTAVLTLSDGATSLPGLLGSRPSSLPLSAQLRLSLVNPELAPCAAAGGGLADGPRAWATLELPRDAPAAPRRPPASLPAGGGGGSRDGGGGGAGSRDGGGGAGRNADGASLREWCAKYDQVTDAPLRDWPKVPHPFLESTRKGKGAPPSPLDKVAAWAAAKFASWPGAAPGCSVEMWTYVRAGNPSERLLHLTARGTRFCFHKGAAHMSNKTMITVDLQSGVAWQRCWDVECMQDGICCGQIKARYCLGNLGLDGIAMPTPDELAAFERD